MKWYSIPEGLATLLLFVFVLSLVLVILGIAVLRGKADALIAGYNTASEKEKAGYHIHRLRIIIGILSFGSAVYVLLIPLLPVELMLLSTGVFILFTLMGVVLANTWAKKQSTW